jgi:hypothetical protein
MAAKENNILTMIKGGEEAALEEERARFASASKLTYIYFEELVKAGFKPVEALYYLSNLLRDNGGATK